MCKSIADGGQRCLSHMSEQISPEFGEAYKNLSLAKKSVMQAGGFTSAYLEEIGKCTTAISKAGLPDETAVAAYEAVNSVVADVLKSAEKNMKLENGEFLTPEFAADRNAARAARTLAQQNLSDHLTKSKNPLTDEGKAKEMSQRWNPENFNEYEGIIGLPPKNSFILLSTPGLDKTFNSGYKLRVKVKIQDRRSSSGGKIAINLGGIEKALIVAGVKEGKIKLLIDNKEGGERVATDTLMDGTHVVTFNIRDKESYSPDATCAINKALIREFRHVRQAQKVIASSPEHTLIEDLEKVRHGKSNRSEALWYGECANYKSEIEDNNYSEYGEDPEGGKFITEYEGGHVWAFLPA